MANIEIERQNSVRAYDLKLGHIRIIFDEITEKDAVEVMVKFLTGGMPEGRAVEKIPDFLL